jgi:hypothetical protein
MKFLFKFNLSALFYKFIKPNWTWIRSPGLLGINFRSFFFRDNLICLLKYLWRLASYIHTPSLNILQPITINHSGDYSPGAECKACILTNSILWLHLECYYLEYHRTIFTSLTFLCNVSREIQFRPELCLSSELIEIRFCYVGIFRHVRWRNKGMDKFA